MQGVHQHRWAVSSDVWLEVDMALRWQINQHLRLQITRAAYLRRESLHITKL